MDDDRRAPAPCRAACPADKNVPEFLRAIARGDTDEAWRIAYRDNLFPGVLGWICPRPCEAACRLARDGEAIPVCDLKRWVTGAHAPPDDLRAEIVAGDGPAIAVIGAGPSGLAAAHDLACAGARVTLLDREARPGGLLAGCIPAFRLPPSVVRDDIRRVLDLGVAFRGGFVLDGPGAIARLRAQGFAAVLVAVGAGDDAEPDIPGWRRGPAQHTAIAFLRDAASGDAAVRARRVVVVGGGNGAFDTARTAVRLGAADVRVVYRRDRAALPAFAREVAAAESEGVRLVTRAVPREVVTEGDRVRGLRCAPSWDGDGATDRTAPPAFDEARPWIEPADVLIFALGQRPGPAAGRLDGPDVFRVLSGGGTVVDAIAAGRRAARALVDTLAGAGRWNAPFALRVIPPVRAVPPAAVVVPGTLPAAVARHHAARCLGCDRLLALDAAACILCGRCAQACAWHALTWSRADGDAWRLSIDDDACRRCGACVETCPSRALGWRPWSMPNRLRPVHPAAQAASPAATSSDASAGRA